MKKSESLIKLTLILIDSFLFFLALTLVLFIRFEFSFFEELKIHFFPFLLFLPFVLIIFLAFSFYDFFLLNKKELFLKLMNVFLLILIFSSFYFYFSQLIFKISPKTNLVLFNIVFIFLIGVFRLIFLIFFQKRKIPVYFLGSEKLKNKLEKDIQNFPFFIFKGNFHKENLEKNSLVIISPQHQLDESFLNYFSNSNLNITFFDYISFYEKFLGRIPLEALDTSFILKEIIQSESKFHFFIKRVFDIFISLIFFFFLFLPLLPLISFLIFISSPGPIFFTQEREGYRGRIFKLIKFRTMHPQKDPHRWATQEEQKRIFFFGKILRKTHLDELPQIFNILKGELSFVGPRPEQPKIAEELKKIIPFYKLRNLALPGITGWGQVNYKYPENIEETKIKLEHDLYYLKNSNIFLDILIIIKTFQKLFF